MLDDNQVCEVHGKLYSSRFLVVDEVPNILQVYCCVLCGTLGHAEEYMEVGKEYLNCVRLISLAHLFPNIYSFLRVGYVFGEFHHND